MHANQSFQVRLRLFPVARVCGGMKFLPALLFVVVLAFGCGWDRHPGLAAAPPGEGNLVGGDPYRPPLQGRGIQHKGSIGLRDYRQAVSDMGAFGLGMRRLEWPEGVVLFVVGDVVFQRDSSGVARPFTPVAEDLGPVWIGASSAASFGEARLGSWSPLTPNPSPQRGEGSSSVGVGRG